jgi:hypothetical protein
MFICTSGKLIISLFVVFLYFPYILMLSPDHYFLAFIVLFMWSLEIYQIEVSPYLDGQVKNFLNGRENE